LHIVQRYRSPSTYPPQQQDTICCKYLSLTLLMMGKLLPETCWADLIDQLIIVASSWFSWVYSFKRVGHGRRHDAWFQTEDI